VRGGAPSPALCTHRDGATALKLGCASGGRGCCSACRLCRACAWARCSAASCGEPAGRSAQVSEALGDEAWPVHLDIEHMFNPDGESDDGGGRYMPVDARLRRKVA